MAMFPQSRVGGGQGKSLGGDLLLELVAGDQYFHLIGGTLPLFCLANCRCSEDRVLSFLDLD